MTNYYMKEKCRLCGKKISTNGLAQFNHKMFHVRRGEMTLRKQRIEYQGRKGRMIYYVNYFEVVKK